MENGHLDPYFTPYIKINLRWIWELNLKAKTIKHLEEKTLWLGSREKFLRSVTETMKEKIDTLDPIKMKKFNSLKYTSEKINMQVQAGI